MTAKDGFQVVVTAWGWKTLPEIFRPDSTFLHAATLSDSRLNPFLQVPTGTTNTYYLFPPPSSASTSPFTRPTAASVASDDSLLSQVCLDKVLAMAEYYRVFVASTFDVVMKLVYEGDPEAEELLNGKEVYEDLVKTQDAASFLGSNTVIALVARLHTCG
ncbi:hypothetical protein Rt10032_c02g1053 [Rhodotorula toruloides]|uniref:Uncharacterized protein n=1 Tax=Rhodotorula toruloides TaxID=5286 RepID=A0A511KAQ9_RHOTO|nr:hypothetical protein Rt10032_c02g1053 [Rhodotorula toruloides]